MTVYNNPISENAFQEAIYDWIDGVLPLWSGTGDRSGKPILVWHMQQAPRGGTPILMARISGLRNVGRDYISRPRNENIDSVMKVAVQQSGTREFILYLEFFGPNAIDNLSLIKDSTQNPYSMDVLSSEGICIFDSGPILDAHVFLGTVPEERALLEISFRTASERIITAAVQIIEKVVMTGKINCGIDVDVSTITIDTLTI